MFYYRRWHWLPFLMIPLLVNSTVIADIVVSPAAIDVGVLASGGSYTTHLTLTNAGAGPIKIVAIEVECATCTKVEFSPASLEAGKSLDVPVTFKPPPADQGRVRRSITIKTDDSRQASLIVPLNAFVTTTAGIWPSTLAPNSFAAPGSDVTLTLELINVSDQPLIPLYATGPVDGPKLALPHAPVPAHGKVQLTAQWHMPSKPGLTTGQITLYVDHPKLTQLSLPFQATVQVNAAPAIPPRAPTVPTTNPQLPRRAALPPGADATQRTSNVKPLTPDASTRPIEMINLDLKDTLPLKDFVDIVATQLKLNLIFDETAMNVPISIRMSGPLPTEALLPLLKTILQAKGLALVSTDRPEFWRIVTSREAQALSEPGGPEGDGDVGQIVTEFITPQSIDVETAAGLLRGFLTPNVGQLTTVPRVKSLIVTDYASQLSRLRRLMELIDKPQAAASVEVIPLKSAEAAPLAERVTKLLGQIAKAEERSALDTVFVTASEEGGSGAIVVVGPEAELPKVTALVKQFDTAPSLVRVDYPVSDQQRPQAIDTIRQVLGSVASNPQGTDGMSRIVTAPQRVSVLATEGQQRRIKELLSGVSTVDGDGIQLKAYRIQNRDASELYATLTRLLGDNRGMALSLDVAPKFPGSSVSTDGISRAGNPPGDAVRVGSPVEPQPLTNRPTTTPNVNITLDAGTNTLLIAANGDTHRRLATLILELDRKQAQVLLEVMLVSVADSDTFAAAVEAAVKANVGGSTIGIGTNAGIGSGDFVKGRTPNVGSGLNAAIFNPASFSVFMQALQQTNKARIMSVPQVLALDNKPALLRSIQQEPFTSVNASTTVATTSFGGFAEAGTTLELTPHIAPADYLNLEYRLEVSSFTGSSSGAGVPPPRRSDAITSFVSVPDGSTVVLGGLRSTNVSKSVAKVPGLGDIPIIGWIGKNENDTNNSAAFYVFVRPTILRSAKFEDLKAISINPKQTAGIKGDYPETIPRFIGN